jgi:hypothetical protein
MQDLCINYRSHVFDKLHIRTKRIRLFDSGLVRSGRREALPACSGFGCSQRFRIAIAQDELPADRDVVPNLPLTQYPSTNNSPATNRTPKMALLCRASAVKLIDDLAGESPASADYPVGTVVISGDGAGDQTVGSPDVNVLVGRTQVWSAPTGGQAKQQVVAKANRSQASKTHTSPESECEDEGNAETVSPS